MSSKDHNCNLCKKSLLLNVEFNGDLLVIRNGEKNKGKIINQDDTICGEYEFGVFNDLAERIKGKGIKVWD